MVYAAERLVTVRSRGWKVALGSATVIVEWGYDLYLQVVQVRALWGMVWRTRRPGDIRATTPGPGTEKEKRKTMYDKVPARLCPPPDWPPISRED